MEDAPTPVYKPMYDRSKRMEEEEKEEVIIESKEYILTKDDNTFRIEINKTIDNLIIRSLNYESKLTIEMLGKLTKIYIETIDEGYKLLNKFFEDNKVSIKDFENSRNIKLQIIITDFSGKKRNIDIDLLFDLKKKDFIINDLQLKCSKLEEEVNKLNNEIKNMKIQINDLMTFKNEINDLKLLLQNQNKSQNIIRSKTQNIIKNEEQNMIQNEIIPQAEAIKNNNTDNKLKINNNNIKKDEINGINKLIPKNLNFIINIATDSYSDWGIDNVFAVFISVDKIPYTVYTTEDKSLIFFNLYQMKVANCIKKAHSYFITNIHHLYDEKENKDIIMSVSAQDNLIKIWNLSNLKLLYKIKNINKKGSLLSTCFLKYNEKYCIATSNGELQPIDFDPIKIYDLKGKKISEIDNSNHNTNFITTYYDNEVSNFLITGNDGFIKSYDINHNANYTTFVDQIYENYSNSQNLSQSYRSAVVISNGNITMLIGSHDDGDIRIWNFYTIKFIKKIKSGNNPLRGICKWNENYIFIGSKDKTIKIVDINNGKIVKSIGGHQSTVLSLKVINLGKSGYCLASQGMGKGEINFWEIQY